MKRTLAALATGLTLLAAWFSTAVAQQASPAGDPAPAAPGMVTARSFHETPSSPSVAVAPYDDSELNLKLKADFENSLRGTGRASIVAEKTAGFLLLFETEVVAADLALRGPSLGSARVNESGAEVNVNVWSSTQDSVLGGRQEGGKAGNNVFHLNAVLRDQRSGEVVWQGDAYYVLNEPETERVARALVPPLVERMGQTVDREPLRIE